MDLIDLYHAHEHALCISDDEQEVEFKQATKLSRDRSSEKDNGGKCTTGNDTVNGTGNGMKKSRWVPWEPYRAAPSADRKGECPKEMPQLIPYNMKGNGKEEENNNDTGKILVDGRRQKREQSIEGGLQSCSKRETELEEELRKAKEELEVERKLNRELKKLMVASMAEELQGEVEALTEDKIRLAHRVEEYAEKIMRDVNLYEEIQIDRDVWKCKFLAQSIRCDELLQRGDTILKLLTKLQADLLQRQDEFPLPPELKSFLETDIYPLFMRSPCESRLHRPAPKYSNLTIACCKNCIGKEIYLL